MKDLSSATQYAKAWISVESHGGDLRKRQNDFEEISDVFISTPGMMKFFRSPSITLQDKEKTLNELFKDKIDPLLLRFLFILLKENKIKDLPIISKICHDLVNKTLNCLNAEIISPFPISDQTLSDIKNQIEKAVKAEIELKVEINPELLAGMILIFSNKMIDLSVEGRLYHLKMKLLGKQELVCR